MLFLMAHNGDPDSLPATLPKDNVKFIFSFLLVEVNVWDCVRSAMFSLKVNLLNSVETIRENFVETTDFHEDLRKLWLSVQRMNGARVAYEGDMPSYSTHSLVFKYATRDGKSLKTLGRLIWIEIDCIN